MEDQYEWLWVYAAVEPLTGDSFFLLMPHVSTECLQAFADGFGAYVTGEKVGVVIDGSGSHKAEAVLWPEHIIRVPLPTYSPELNPAEAIFRHLRAKLANRIFENLDELEEAITEALRPFWDEPARLQSLTGYSWWTEGTKAIAK